MVHPWLSGRGLFPQAAHNQKNVDFVSEGGKRDSRAVTRVKFTSTDIRSVNLDPVNKWNQVDKPGRLGSRHTPGVPENRFHGQAPESKYPSLSSLANTQSQLAPGSLK